MQKQNIIAYVASLPPGATESIRKYEKTTKQKYRIMLIVDSKSRKSEETYDDLDIFVKMDFAKPAKIAEALLPYQDELLAVTCRSEPNMKSFAAVIPHVPYLRTPTTESLHWATDKLEMRKRMALYDKKNTPKFTRVRNNTKVERERVIKRIGFPMVVKPANLAQSLLISICYHEEELEKTLRTMFRKIKKAYGENGRKGIEPKILAEQYMDGDLYSVDAYVDSRGNVAFCPMVKVVTGRDIGHDDFYNYMHLTPTGLKKANVEQAREVARRGIHALGLRSTSAHVEFLRVEDDWKLIEIGPRVGGFRHKLHQMSCDIDHSLNDVLVRIPKKRSIPKKCKGYAAALKWFPKKEGRITKLKGIKKVRELRSFHDITVAKKVGDRCYFAKNGGKAVFTLLLYNTERSKLLADIRRVEQGVDIQIR